MSVLETRQVSRVFGELAAVDRVDFKARTGQLNGIIGPNGAGKTTFIRCITGRYRVTGGEVLHRDERVTQLEEYQRARRGIVSAEQLISIYPDLNVYNNIVTASLTTRDEPFWLALFQSDSYRDERTIVHRRAMELLDYVGLKERCYDTANNLAYGQKKRLMIAMALATDPEFLILDEPVAGLNPEESSEVVRIIRSLVEQEGLGILLIEHDMGVVMNNCDYITVLDSGRKIAEGTPEHIGNDAAVQEAYLG